MSVYYVLCIMSVYYYICIFEELMVFLKGQNTFYRVSRKKVCYFEEKRKEKRSKTDELILPH